MTSTADLLDEFGDAALVCLIQFRSFGAPSFDGPIATVWCNKDNVYVRTQASQLGRRPRARGRRGRLDALRAAR